MTAMNGTQVRDESPVTDLVARASSGDTLAWDGIVDRYAPLVWAICRKYRLPDADAEDAAQTVWLHLVNQLGKLRDPAALPGWMAITTRRECLRVLRKDRRSPSPTCRGTSRRSRTPRSPMWISGCCWPSVPWRCARHSPICPRAPSS